MAMQAQLLAHESRTTKVSNQGASSVVASEVPPRVDESLNTAAREKQKVSCTCTCHSLLHY